MLDLIETQLRGFIHHDLGVMGFTPEQITAMPETVDAMLPQYIRGELAAAHARLEARKLIVRTGLTPDYRAMWERDIPRVQQQIKDLQALERRWQ